MEEFIKYGLCLIGLIVLYKLYNFFKDVGRVLNSRIDNITKGAAEGIKEGVKHGLARLSGEYIDEKLGEITKRVYDEKNFNNLDKFTELKNEFRSYIFSRIDKRADEVITVDLIKNILKNDLVPYVKENYDVDVESVILEDK